MCRGTEFTYKVRQQSAYGGWKTITKVILYLGNHLENKTTSFSWRDVRYARETQVRSSLYVVQLLFEVTNKSQSYWNNLIHTTV